MLPQMLPGQKAGGRQQGIPYSDGGGYTAAMSDIVITRKHGMGIRKARIAAERVAADLQTEFSLDYAWQEANLLVFERPGVNGELRLARHEVALSVRLGLFYLPFRGALEREIHDYFDREFAA